MHIHQLTTDQHARFLEEQRRDPVTGETLRAGHEVVFCNVCGTVFLHESWSYIGQQHCGQQKTRSEIPTARNVRLKPRTSLGEIRYEAPLFKKDNRSTVLNLLTGTFYPFTWLSGMILERYFPDSTWLKALFVGGAGGVIALILLRYGYRYLNERRPIFRDRGIEIKGVRTRRIRKLRYAAIAEITVFSQFSSRKARLLYDQARIRLRITPKDGLPLTVAISEEPDDLNELIGMLRELSRRHPFQLHLDQNAEETARQLSRRSTFRLNGIG